MVRVVKFEGKYSFFYKHAVVNAADNFGEELFFEKTRDVLVKSKRELKKWRSDLNKLVLPQPKFITLNSYYGFNEDRLRRQLRLAEKDMLCDKRGSSLKSGEIRLLLNKFQSGGDLTNKEKKSLCLDGMIDNAGLTKSGEMFLISNKSLKYQCEKLGLCLLRVDLPDRNKRVEHALLDHLSADGDTRWFYIENQFYGFLFSTLIHPIYSYLGVGSDSEVFEDDKEEEFINYFTPSYFNEVLADMVSENMVFEDRYGYGYSAIETESLLGIYKAVGYDFFKEMVVFKFRDNLPRSIGWPDLIGIGSSGIKFVEVKKKDNLTLGQISNFPFIKDQGFPLTICVVTDTNRP